AALAPLGAGRLGGRAGRYALLPHHRQPAVSADWSLLRLCEPPLSFGVSRWARRDLRRCADLESAADPAARRLSDPLALVAGRNARAGVPPWLDADALPLSCA